MGQMRNEIGRYVEERCGRVDYELTTMDGFFAGGLFQQPLSARHGAHDQKRLGSSRNRLWQRCVRQFVGEILFAGEEPDERATRMRDVVADRSAQHRIAGFERVKYLTLRDGALDVEPHLTVNTRKRSQMRWKDNPDHRLLLAE